MVTHKFNTKRLAQLEELLDIEYEKIHEFEKAIALADGASHKIALRAQLKRQLTPELAKHEQEYARLLADGIEPQAVADDEAREIVAELARATARAQESAPDEASEEMLQLLTEIKGKLDEPGKSAAAKLKVTLPILPLISSYELTLDTENFLTEVWRKVIGIAKRWRRLPPQ